MFNRLITNWNILALHTDLQQRLLNNLQKSNVSYNIRDNEECSTIVIYGFPDRSNEGGQFWAYILLNLEFFLYKRLE